MVSKILFLLNTTKGTKKNKGGQYELQIVFKWCSGSSDGTDLRKQASCFFMVFHGIFSVQDRSAAGKGGGNIVKNVSNYTMEPVSCEPLAGIFMQFTGENVCGNQ